MEKRNTQSVMRLNTNTLLQIIILFIIIEPSSAQIFTTPETFSYKQEVFRPVSFYTGQADISIPLLEIKTNEITIPVSLKYIGGEGLRPINPYSNVGFGWKLSAGGIITRTVNGEPDEFNIPGTGRLMGFFSLPANSTTDEYVRNNASSFLKPDGSGVRFISNYEYSPDIFSFSFLGYSGYFLMDYDKSFKIQSRDIVKVEKFDSSLPDIGNNPFYFRLTSNDGTKFTFGAEEGSVEISGGENAIPFQFNAWYITRIDFPNGRYIYFNYKPNKNIRIHFKTSDSQSIFSTESPVVLDNITFNGGKVIIYSSFRSHYISSYNDLLLIIDKIELQDVVNQRISQVILKYSPKIYDRYQILDSLRIDGKRYLFEYNSVNNLPETYQSYRSDYWGFYNGQPEITGPVGVGYRDPYLNQTLTLPRKMPSEEHAKLGILTSVTFPTGDKELFEYEAHTYSYSGVQTLGGYYNSYSEEPKKAGGLRIAKITLGNQVRKYKYVNFFDPNNPDYIPGSMSYIGFSSSGILYKFPSVCYMAAEALNFLSIEGEPPVVYQRVIEFLSDKSYTVYEMNSPLNRPDGQNNQNTNYFECWASNPVIFNNVFKSIFIGALGKNSSCALERGQITEIRIYDSSNTLKRKISYTYSSNPGRYNQYVASIYMTGTAEQRMSWLAFELGLQYLNNSQLAFSLLHSYCIYTFPVLLEKEEITDYYNGQSITNTTQYRYNDKRLKSAIITYDSRGDSLKTIIRYPSDINTGVYASMKTLNMLNYPVEQITLKNNKFTGSTLTTYKANGTGIYFYVPDKVYSLEITSPLASFTFFNGTSRDSHYSVFPDISYDSYSTSGNLRQITGKDETPVSYLWDGSDIYPIAQVKGSTYLQIKSFEGKACDYSSITLWSGLKSLASTAQISTYSYKPLTGLSSFTDPRGVTTYYTYDVSGRLFLVRDDDKNISGRFRYGYRNYPDNGLGGYTALNAYVIAPSIVTKGISKTATANVTGGTGSFIFNWYLKNSSGTVISSFLNDSSGKFNFTCYQTGSFYISCEITDNMIGTKITRISNTFTSCVSECSFTMNTGFVNLSSTILNMGTTVSFYLTFYSSSAMQPNVTYLIAFISSGCRPSGTRIYNIDSIMGRSWEITIDSYGYVYFKMTRGEEMPAYYSESTGTLTYNL